MKTVIDPKLSTPPRLLDQVRARIRTLHYSIRTEQAHADWIKRYILFSGKRHPRDLSAQHVERFLSHLAVERNVAASTQNQAKSALLFLYKEVLGVELPWLEGVMQARIAGEGILAQRCGRYDADATDQRAEQGGLGP